MFRHIFGIVSTFLTNIKSNIDKFIDLQIWTVSTTSFFWKIRVASFSRGDEPATRCDALLIALVFFFAAIMSGVVCSCITEGKKNAFNPRKETILFMELMFLSNQRSKEDSRNQRKKIFGVRDACSAWQPLTTKMDTSICFLISKVWLKAIGWWNTYNIGAIMVISFGISIICKYGFFL